MKNRAKIAHLACTNSWRILMNVNGINPAQLISGSVSNPQSNRQAKTGDPSALSSQQLSGPEFGVRSFEQTSLSLLRAIVDDSAARLDIYDLSNFDTSPEDTAKRIADFAIGMYSIYKKQHHDMEESERLGKYEDVVRRAVDKGFRKAMGILSGSNALNDNVLRAIDKTYELVQRKFGDFFDQANQSIQAQSQVASAVLY